MYAITRYSMQNAVYTDAQTAEWVYTNTRYSMKYEVYTDGWMNRYILFQDSIKHAVLYTDGWMNGCILIQDIVCSMQYIDVWMNTIQDIQCTIQYILMDG